MISFEELDLISREGAYAIQYPDGSWLAGLTQKDNLVVVIDKDNKCIWRRSKQFLESLLSMECFKGCSVERNDYPSVA